MKPLTEATAATIASSGTASAPIDVRYAKYGMFLMPAVITTSTAVTFTACETRDGTYAVIRDISNSIYSITFTVANWHPFPAGVVQGSGFIKIVVADAQAADREFIIQLQRDES